MGVPAQIDHAISAASVATAALSATAGAGVLHPISIANLATPHAPPRAATRRRDGAARALCGVHMRTLLFAALSSALVACAASPADDHASGGGGGGGKADDTSESSCPEGLDDPDTILAAIEGGGNC